MKKIHIIIIGMLVAALAAASVFCTAAWCKNRTQEDAGGTGDNYKNFRTNL